MAKFDPEFIEKRIPRHLEIEAFLSYSLIMAGDIRKGITMARDTFMKFDKHKDGHYLKSKDYFTWAVWKSGIPIRTLNALILKRSNVNKGEIVFWLNEVKRDLSKKGYNFGLRRDELTELKRKLQEIN